MSNSLKLETAAELSRAISHYLYSRSDEAALHNLSEMRLAIARAENGHRQPIIVDNLDENHDEEL